MDFDFSKISGKNFLITGGLGFLGANLARRLASLNAKVTIFSRVGKNRENLRDIEEKLEFIEGNLANDSDVFDAVKNKDYIFHFAWQNELKKSMQNPKEDLMTDVLGILNLLEICKKENPNVKIIFTSTPTVVGYAENQIKNEGARENPISIYEANKLIAEKYLHVYYKNYNMKFCVLRLSNVFGEFQRIDNPSRGVLNFMIGRALRGEPLKVYGTGEFIRDYTYVQNYVDAFILASVSEKTNGEVFHLGSGEGRTFNEVVEKIKKIVETTVGKNVTITHVPFPEGENEINKRNEIIDFSKFRDATGWFPKISFDEGLERTIEFYVNGIKS